MPYIDNPETPITNTFDHGQSAVLVWVCPFLPPLRIILYIYIYIYIIQIRLDILSSHS